MNKLRDVFRIVGPRPFIVTVNGREFIWRLMERAEGDYRVFEFDGSHEYVRSSVLSVNTVFPWSLTDYIDDKPHAEQAEDKCACEFISLLRLGCQCGAIVRYSPPR